MKLNKSIKVALVAVAASSLVIAGTTTGSAAPKNP